MRPPILLAALTLLACYRPEARDCAVSCGEGGACPEGATCSHGLCTTGPACPAPPAPLSCATCAAADISTARCRGDAVVRCSEGGWSEETVCTGAQPVCAGGACLACQPGTSRCNAGCAEACGASGTWSASARCEPCLARAAPSSLALGWSHGCALFAAGVQCWGANDYGQLGLGDTGLRGLAPHQLGAALPVTNLGAGARVTALSAGGRHTCALLETGQVKCWGDNSSGQLGLGDANLRGDEVNEMDDALRSVDLGLDRTATAIAAGGRHTCAVLDDGTVKCWGANDYGQLGLGDTAARGDEPCEMGDALATVALGGERATALAAGGFHSCALLESGNVTCWGYNGNGQLGAGDTKGRGHSPESPPARVDFVDGLDLIPEPVRALAAGHHHTCALFASGVARCWGANDAGQLGLGKDTGSQAGPWLLTDLPFGAGVASVVAGVFHTCALLADGQVKCWGLNTFGQLGLGDTRNRGDAVDEPIGAIPFVDIGSRDSARNLLLAARALAAGGDHTCALLETGRLKCWGENAFGQLGIGQAGHRGDDPGEMGDALPEVQLPHPVVSR